VEEDFQTIGENKVVVPAAFFKVLLQEDGGELHAIGFIYENVGGRRPMSTYAMTVDEVEAVTGIDFFPSLPDKTEDKVEAEADFSHWVIKKDKMKKGE
jgi:endonuclease G